MKRFRMTNNLPGAQLATVAVAQAATKLDYTCVEIGWESTGML